MRTIQCVYENEVLKIIFTSIYILRAKFNLKFEGGCLKNELDIDSLIHSSCRGISLYAYLQSRKVKTDSSDGYFMEVTVSQDLQSLLRLL